MEHAVLLTKQPDNGYTARSLLLPEIVVSGDDEASLAAKVLREEHRIYPQAVRWFAEGRLRVEDGRVKLAGADVPAVLGCVPAIDAD